MSIVPLESILWTASPKWSLIEAFLFSKGESVHRICQRRIWLRHLPDIARGAKKFVFASASGKYSMVFSCTIMGGHGNAGKKLLKLGSRRRAVDWAMTEKRYKQKRAGALAGIDPRVYRRVSKRPAETELRGRQKELSSERRRFGYHALHWPRVDPWHPCVEAICVRMSDAAFLAGLIGKPEEESFAGGKD